ncbi:MAG: glycosyltransferase family 4 protein, partial [Bacteroidota bacterium]
MILPGSDFPPDIRVEKETRLLRDNGHRVVVMCDMIKSQLAKQIWEGITIIRRKRIPVPTLFEKFNGIPLWNSFLDWQWTKFITKVVQDESLDALHIHDLPKTAGAVATGKKLNLPVVVDLHENFPGSMHTYVEGLTGIRRRIFRLLINARKWSEYEQKHVSQADHVIAVVSEAKERLINLGISKHKIAVIENTEPLPEHRQAVDESIVNRYKDDFIILYVGGFGGRSNHRGLTTAVAAMPAVLKSIPHAHLLLVGKGTIKFLLDRMISDKGLENNVTIIDWVPFEQVHSYIAASKVCLLPYTSTPNTEASSPNKLYQYMSMGKPVVVSSCKSLKRVIEETGCGSVFQAGDPVDMARAINDLS